MEILGVASGGLEAFDLAVGLHDRMVHFRRIIGRYGQGNRRRYQPWENLSEQNNRYST
jgi:hypothetical protein